MNASFVAALVILDGLPARLAARNAVLCSLVYKGFAEPISVIPSVSEEPFSLGQAIHQGRNASIIAYLAGGYEQADRTAAGVCYSMQLGVHVALGQPD